MSSSAEVAPVAALPDAHVATAEEPSREAKRKGGVGMTILLSVTSWWKRLDSRL